MIIFIHVFLFAVLLAVFLATGVVVGWLLVRFGQSLVPRNPNAPDFRTHLELMSADEILPNYITSIKGHLPKLRQEPVDSGSWETSWHAISQVADQMGKHLERLRLIRTGLDETRIRVEPVNLAGLIENIILKTLEPAAAEKNITLRLEFQQIPIPPVSGDREILSMIFTTLLENAIKHNPPETEVVADLIRQDGFARVRISDNGKGIKEELLKIIFVPGVRLGLAGAPRGAGMGLYIAKMLTELQGGTITVESQLGEGSVFSVSLPFERPEVLAETQKNTFFSRMVRHLFGSKLFRVPLKKT